MSVMNCCCCPDVVLKDLRVQGPLRLIRSTGIMGYEFLEPLYEKTEGKAYLCIDRVRYGGREGGVLTYCNPPMHQVGTPWLYAYHEGLDRVWEAREDLDFLLLHGGCGAVHSGGDLKESLGKLRASSLRRKELEAAGASAEEIYALFSWGEERLEKGLVVYDKIRRIAREMRVVGLAGGGMRFGGSAEILLMADYLLGDSRSGMCFSEAMIGIIPGWAGIGRVLTKAGRTTAAYMTKTARALMASDLHACGVYNELVQVPFPLPERSRTENPEADQRRYLEETEINEDRTGSILLPKALDLAVCHERKVPRLGAGERRILVDREALAREVARRAEPMHYAGLWHRPLKEVKHEIQRLGRPLAPQSIAALDALLETYDPAGFDERRFVREELEADAALYRDPRFLEGLTAMLEGRVPDFRLER